jgi:hypothetical protein
MSRNSDRVGSPTPTNNTAADIVSNNNSIFEFVTPIEIVELPTQGKFYPPEHPLHNVDKIEIKHMTAKDTDILTSQSFLKQGIAVDRMLENVIINKDIKVAHLFTGDKNALIVACRINGFGNEYNTQVNCPSCATTAEHSFDLNEVKIKELSSEVDITSKGTFIVDLPKCKAKVECRLLNGEDEHTLFDISEKKKKWKLPDTVMTDQYKIFIESINGESERGLVEKFIEIMPAYDARYLRKTYESVTPNLDMKHAFECSSCSSVTQLDIPFSANFFWPQ